MFELLIHKCRLKNTIHKNLINKITYKILILPGPMYNFHLHSRWNFGMEQKSFIFVMTMFLIKTAMKMNENVKSNL